MGHSKGGVDILDVLVNLEKNKDTRNLSLIRGFIPIQSPLQGTPMADLADQPINIFDPWASHTTTFRSIFNNMDFLSTENRRNWLAEHQKELSSLNSKIDTIAVGSYIHRHHTFFTTILAIMMRPALWLSGELNDGLVAYRGSRLPGASKITLPGIDHVATAMAMPIPKTAFNQDAFTYALLKLQAQRLRSCNSSALRKK
jgi:hypothetical protein